ncbi:unnamed protein product [Rhizoctonia solani]|uniref:WW domain-containing protein n=1 Tax=Rhizoctonia solani TaxID=456999 RepID=A0A8H3D6D6_9AGAM|nr:unnamed protein product [Rhizoctonia solani]
MQELLSSPYLIEWAPSDTQRYNDTLSVRSAPTVIPSALFEPQSFKTNTEIPAPDGWQTYVNPAEGRPYFWSPSLRIFTESNIAEGHVLNRLIDWSRTMRPLLNQSNRSDYDIVLKVSENMEQGMGTCHYYLVDHTLKVVFWLREISTGALGFPDSRNNED